MYMYMYQKNTIVEIVMPQTQSKRSTGVRIDS